MYVIFDIKLDRVVNYTLENLCDMYMHICYTRPDFEERYKKQYREYWSGKWSDSQKIQYLESKGYKVQPINHMYSVRFLRSLTKDSLLILMEEHGYDEYEEFDKKELIDVLSRVEM